MNNRRGRIGVYAVVPLALISDPEVTFRMLKVYAAIASFQGTGDKCWPSRDAIARRANVSKNHVSDETGKLESLGWLSKESRQSDSRSSIYRVHVDLIDAEERVPPTGPPGPTDGTTLVPDSGTSSLYRKLLDSGSNAEEPNRGPIDGYQSVIDEYYQLHQKRTGAKPTITAATGKAFKELLKVHGREIVLKKLKAFYASRDWFAETPDAMSFRRHFDKIAIKNTARANVKKCSHCGDETDTTSTFCEICGAPYDD